MDVAISSFYDCDYQGQFLCDVRDFLMNRYPAQDISFQQTETASIIILIWFENSAHRRISLSLEDWQELLDLYADQEYIPERKRYTWQKELIKLIEPF